MNGRAPLAVNRIRALPGGGAVAVLDALVADRGRLGGTTLAGDYRCIHDSEFQSAE
jgi:hypothetical protein